MKSSVEAEQCQSLTISNPHDPNGFSVTSNQSSRYVIIHQIKIRLSNFSFFFLLIGNNKVVLMLWSETPSRWTGGGGLRWWTEVVDWRWWTEVDWWWTGGGLRCVGTWKGYLFWQGRIPPPCFTISAHRMRLSSIEPL